MVRVHGREYVRNSLAVVTSGREIGHNHEPIGNLVVAQTVESRRSGTFKVQKNLQVT